MASYLISRAFAKSPDPVTEQWDVPEEDWELDEGEDLDSDLLPEDTELPEHEEESLAERW